MSKLEELIEKLCPKGVKFLKLKDFCEIKTGNGLTKRDTIVDGKYKIISGGIEPLGLCNITNRNANTVTIARAGSAGYVNFIEEDFYLNDKCFSVIPQENVVPKFLYYALSNIQDNIYALKSSGTVPTVNTEKVSKISVPVPPVEIQEEIVHILDNLTKLSSELSTEISDELKSRRKQYEYYRDTLIKNAPNAEYKLLEEISLDMYRGAGIKRNEVTAQGTPCVRYGEIYTSYNVAFDKCISHTEEEKRTSKKYFEYGDVLFAITGESVEEIAKSIVYLGNDKCMAGGDIVVMKHNQNPKYIAYALSTTEAQIQKSKGKVKSKVVHSSVPSLKEIMIPIPSLEEQEKIANIIEKFDALCNKLSEALLAEIEARQKQYEYYRDKLLTFKELKVEK